MKGLATLSFIALLYILIIIIFSEAAGEPRGVQNEDNVEQMTSGSESANQSQDQGGPRSKRSGTKRQTGIPEAKFGNVAKTEEHLPSSKKDANQNAKKQAEARATNDNGQVNGTNPLADLFQITDPVMRDSMAAIYGAYNGNDQCSRKAFCIMGNSMKDMPGRDLFFLLMSSYIPKEFSLYYEIFKVAVIYGQNCNVYVCLPNPDPNDAASSAAPKPSVPQSSPTPIPFGTPR